MIIGKFCIFEFPIESHNSTRLLHTIKNDENNFAADVLSYECSHISMAVPDDWYKIGILQTSAPTRTVRNHLWLVL